MNKPFPYTVMEQKADALERLDIRFRWGGFGLKVLRFHYTSFAAGKVIPFHKHAEYEFHFIPRGKGTVMLGKHEYNLSAGMFYLTGPGVLHRQEADPREAMDELCLHIDIIPLDEPERVKETDWGNSIADEEARECVACLESLPLVPEVDRYHAMPWFLTAYKACMAEQIGVYSTITQSIIQILLRAVRVYHDEPAARTIPSRDMKDYRFQLASRYIANNCSSPLSLADVADKINISSRQLQRIFAEQTGETFSSYLEHIRISRVCSDLLESFQSMEDIAFNNGFSSSNYLYRVFKKRLGMTPSQYKRVFKKSGFQHQEG